MPCRVALLAAAALLSAGCSLPEAPPLRRAPAEPRPAAEGLPPPNDAQAAVVVRVSDGDTVRLRGRGTGPVPAEPTRVRLLLADTPEVHGEVECYGPEATTRAEELLPVGSTVRVQPDRRGQDRYGRLLLHVWNDDGVNVGAALVAEGYATVLQVDPNRRYLDAFRAHETAARSAGLGLWSAC